MTNNEIIKFLQSKQIPQCGDKEYTADEEYEAYQKAIDALDQQPCDDVVSRKDAEQMFRNIRSHLKPQDYKSAEEFNTRDLMLLNAEQMIHALPSVTQKSGKWIPVSERLPEKYTYTLWCASSGCVRSDYFNGEFWEDAKKYCYEVIAWMPLPEPYEPQESEDKE